MGVQGFKSPRIHGHMSDLTREIEMFRKIAALFSSPGPKFCFRCGAQNDPSASYCVGCGAKLDY